MKEFVNPSDNPQSKTLGISAIEIVFTNGERITLFPGINLKTSDISSESLCISEGAKSISHLLNPVFPLDKLPEDLTGICKDKIDNPIIVGKGPKTISDNKPESFCKTDFLEIKTRKQYTKDPNKKYGAAAHKSKDPKVTIPEIITSLQPKEKKKRGRKPLGFTKKEIKTNQLLHQKELQSIEIIPNSSDNSQSKTLGISALETTFINKIEYYLVPDQPVSKNFTPCNSCDFWQNGCQFPLGDRLSTALNHKECRTKKIHYIVKKLEPDENFRKVIGFKQSVCDSFLQNSEKISIFIGKFYNPLRFTKLEIFAKNQFESMLVDCMKKIYNEVTHNPLIEDIDTIDGWKEFCSTYLLKSK